MNCNIFERVQRFDLSENFLNLMSIVPVKVASNLVFRQSVCCPVEIFV